MTGPVTVVWDEGLLAYDFGPEHPLRPGRVALTMALAREAGMLERAKVVTPMALSGADLARVHDLDYLAAVQAASETGLPVFDYGLAPGDNPPFPGMHDAAMLVCGATVAAAAAILAGDALHTFSPAGGDRLDAGAGDRAGRLRRRRRPPRRRGRGDLRGRATGADHLGARVRAVPVPGHGLRARDRRGRRSWHHRQPSIATFDHR